MDIDVVGNGKLRSGKKRNYSLILIELVGLAALWVWAALSLDTSAQARHKVGSQPPPFFSLAPACGHDWAVVSSPNQGTSINYLNGVAAVGANDVWAVGFYNDDTNGVRHT